MNRIIVLLLAVLVSFNIYGQGSGCGSDIIHNRLYASDSAYHKSHKHIENSIVAKSQQIGLTKNDTLLTIPIVFHIIHKGEKIGTGSNLSDDIIHEAIQGLNDRFAAKLGAGINSKIQFCFAVRDPNGNYTTGINRVDGRVVKGFDSLGLNPFINQPGGPEKDVKDLSKWPVTDYYNIWVVHNVVGYSGFAKFPSTHIDPYDGTVIRSSSVNYYHTLLTHEVGHGLNLYHVFNQVYPSCPGSKDCATKGDKVCDTPPTVDFGSGYCQKYEPCSSNYPWSNTRNNYMSYCSNIDRFTEGQIDRMRTSISVTVRDSLLYSKACTPGHKDDAGIKKLIICDSNIYAVIKNYGGNVISKCSAKLSLNDTLVRTVSWTGKLSTYEQDTILIASNLLLPDSGVLLSCWTNLPNGIKDTIYLNDSFSLDSVFLPLKTGSYTIGGKNADFTTLFAAVEALNQRGICGSVTFNIRTGIYSEQITLGEIRGVNPFSIITFQSEKQHKDSVTMRYDLKSVATNYIWKLNGTDHITFKDLTFTAKGNTNYSTLIHLSNGAHNNNFTRCTFNGQNLYTSSSYYGALVYSPSTLDTGIVFRHNVFNNGAYAIMHRGGLPLGHGIIVDSNEMNNQGYNAVYLYNSNSPKINNNLIRSTKNLFTGIYVSTSGNELEIMNNQVYGQIRGGINLYNCTSITGKTGIVANNFIKTNTDYNFPGLRLRQCRQLQIFHNTIRHHGVDSNNSVVRFENSDYLEVYNNIFANNSGGYAMYFYNTDLDHNQLNYNDVYSSGAKLIYADSIFKTLQGWTKFSGFEKKSLSLKPQFLTDTSYYLCAPELARAGFKTSSVLFDIENLKRHSVSPSLGVKKLDLQTLDLGTDKKACDSIMLSSNVVSNNLTWNTNDSTTTIWVDSSGVYFAEYTNHCETQTDSINVIVVKKPVVQLGNDTLICSPYTLYNPIDSNSYLWSTGDTSKDQTISTNGSYWLKATNLCGSNADTINIDVDTKPIIKLGRDTSLCDSLLLKASSHYKTTWQNGSIDSVFNVTQTGLYILKQENICGESSDSIFVTIYPKPVVTLGNDTFACDSISLYASVKNHRYLWNTLDTTNSISIHNNGFYYLTVRNEYECSIQSDSIWVEIHKSPKPSLGNDTTLGNNQVYSIHTDKQYKSYLWSNSSTKDQLEIVTNDLDSFQNFWVIVTDSNGCKGTDSIEIRLNQLRSVGTFGNNFFRIYPNPAENYIHIVRPNDPSKIEIDIYDALGQLLLYSNLNPSQTRINLPDLASGTYTLHIKDNITNKVFVTKILVK